MERLQNKTHNDVKKKKKKLRMAMLGFKAMEIAKNVTYMRHNFSLCFQKERMNQLGWRFISYATQ